MEGLEFNEVKLSEVKDVETFRIDSDYFLEKYIKQHKLIKNKKNNFLILSDLNINIDASAFYPSLEPFYNTGEIPFIRVADVNDFIDYESCLKIPKNILENPAFKTLKLIKKGDIVITKGGSIGRVALIDRYTAVTRDLIFINSSKLSKKDYIYLHFYLKCNFAYSLMLQSSSMTAQPHLTLTLIKNLPILKASNKFKEKIKDIYDSLVSYKNKSQLLYLQAEGLVLEELGLKDFRPSQEEVNIKRFKESFASTGRLDAEYYQPKYEDIVQKIKQYSNGFDTVNNLLQVNSKNYNPKDDSQYKYIELSNIGRSGEITGCLQGYGADLPSRARQMVKHEDVMISSIEGSLSSIAIVGEEYHDALCSTGFHIARSKYLNSETLLILLKSVVGQMQLKKGCSGTILTAINIDELNQIVLPHILSHTQEEIKSKIQKAVILRKQSKQLLEVAKLAVEMAIEKNETTAMAWLENEVATIEAMKH